MKIIFQFCFLFIILQFRSQTGDTLPQGKFDLGFTASPDYSYRILRSGASESWIKNIYDTTEVARVAYTAGIQLVFHASKKLFISTGVLISERGEKTKKYLVTPVTNYVNHYYYLSVPVRANYYILVKKIKLFLSAGFAADIYLAGQSSISTGQSGEKKPVTLSSEIAPLNIAFNGGFGLDCPVTDRWYFKLQPEYRSSITPVSNGPIKKYFYSFGLNMGFFCKL